MHKLIILHEKSLHDIFFPFWGPHVFLLHIRYHTGNYD